MTAAAAERRRKGCAPSRQLPGRRGRLGSGQVDLGRRSRDAVQMNFMSVKLGVLAVALASVVAAVGCGGGASPEKMCAKLIELREKAGKKVKDSDKSECKAELERELKDCKDMAAVGACIDALTDYKGDDACFAKCK